ncbi:SufD family Fe-S cluster assembly protein [Candidatus Bathyarchaeota archaeon]|nr:SufD family Fe-S cluster assembly protein [Candidatus Bathyarchaeota archaeon]
MDTKDALEKYPWLKERMWTLVNKDKDEYTQEVAESWSGGYFIHIKPGAEIDLPLQSCLMLNEENTKQRIHNIIIAGKGSNTQILTTCVQHHEAKLGAHFGVSEIWVEDNAKLTFTMVHQWAPETLVRPRTGIQIASNSEFISNYICLTPAKDVQMSPLATCNGLNSKAILNNVLYVHNDSVMDIGSEVELKGHGSVTELNTRAVIRSNSYLVSRGTICGNSEKCRGHLECRGILLDNEAFLEAIPILSATNSGAELSHEAAIGKLNEEEIVYLMSRGLNRDESVGVLVRGFMDVSMMGLSKDIKKNIESIIDLVAEAS